MGVPGTLRLWPGIVILALQWIVTYGSGLWAPSTMVHFWGITGGPSGGLLLIWLWWIFASRAPRRERLLGAALLPAALTGAFALAHPTMPMMIDLYGIPTVCAAFVGSIVVAQRWSGGRRMAAMAAVLLAVAGAWTLTRTQGVDGNMGALLTWRFAPTAEERLLAAENDAVPTLEPPAENEPDTSSETAVWPGFRGPERRGVVSAERAGLRLATDWETTPPEEVWRHPVGPGWSSFTVVGERLFTQEQRGDEEIVTALDAATGEPLWRHRDPARFWEALSGAGPRATPIWDAGRLYAFGATGVLNALDAATGTPHWRRDAAADTGAAIPEWGFASSPLVHDGLVVVYTGAPGGKAVVAYDAESGEPRWYAPAGAAGYSSVQRVQVAGVEQFLIATGDGLSSLAPADGAVLFRHEWPIEIGGSRVVQPALTPDGDVLLGTGFGMGTRRFAVELTDDGWQTEERWTSRGMKPYYNDFVVHRGHVYGFDGRILVCLDLETGDRRWKGGRYGNGQLLLLPEQDLLLVLSDRGLVALVEARPDELSELARMPAIEGKTWNHPVLADGVLYVRNGQEMAAFRMPALYNVYNVARVNPPLRWAGKA